MQGAAERGLLRLVCGRAEALVKAGLAAMAWLPPGPLPQGPSAYVTDLLAYLAVG